MSELLQQAAEHLAQLSERPAAAPAAGGGDAEARGPVKTILDERIVSVIQSTSDSAERAARNMDGIVSALKGLASKDVREESKTIGQTCTHVKWMDIGEMNVYSLRDDRALCF